MALLQRPAAPDAAPAGVEMQPVSMVTWVDRGTLHANSYNPNHVASPELKLLRRSILEDGWTQPIVARRDGEITDGFHRWTIAAEPAIAALTGGLVPVVYLRDDLSTAHQIMSTIRHNRARGQHHVVKMADIVATLLADGTLTDTDLMKRLGMDKEEVKRLRSRGDMIEHFADEDFDKGWVPDVPDNVG